MKERKSYMSKSTWGIFYIFWIIIAWTIINLYQWHYAISPVAKEFIRGIVFIGPILLFIINNMKQPWYKWLGLYGCKKGTVYKTSIVALLYIVVCLVVNIYVFQKTTHFHEITAQFWWTAFTLSIFMEEISFRGFLFYLFQQWNKNIVVIITSLAFAAKHLPALIIFPVEISPAGFIGDLIWIFLVGCILGYLYIATHSVWATLMIHSINNFIVALFY